VQALNSRPSTLNLALPPLSQIESSLLEACREVCRAADAAAESTHGPPGETSARLAEIADRIRAIELGLAKAFLGPESTKQALMFGQGAQPVSAAPVPLLLPVDPSLKQLTTPEEADRLIHDIRGIRTVFSLGSELTLGPTERPDLLSAAAQMTRRLEPMLQEFLGEIRGRGGNS
jgi:hypothetical protein